MGRRLVKVIGVFLLGITGLLLLTIGAGLAYRAHRQDLNAQALTIHCSRGIDEARFVGIGGIAQWITVRGQDRDNPVLLFLHGGPGEATNLTYYRQFISWTHDFTVVQWDQRGAGKTFGATGMAVASSMTIARMAQDGIELAEFLRSHLHKRKIILVGHSWGSILGIRMAKARPDLFYAYVGTGQVVNVQRSLAIDYRRLLARAQASGNAVAVRELRKIGAPPFRTMQALLTQDKWAQTYEGAGALVNGELTSALFAPGYSLRDLYGEVGSLRVTLGRLVGASLSGPMMKVDIKSLGPDFALPVFVFDGPDDYITSPALARDYVDWIKTPRKEFVMLKAGGHFALYTDSPEFLKELVTHVRPLAIGR